MNFMLYCIFLIYFNEFKNVLNWLWFLVYYKGCLLLIKLGVSYVLFSEVERKRFFFYCLKLLVEIIDILVNYFCIINWKKKGKVCKFLKN